MIKHIWQLDHQHHKLSKYLEALKYLDCQPFRNVWLRPTTLKFKIFIKSAQDWVKSVSVKPWLEKKSSLIQKSIDLLCQIKGKFKHRGPSIFLKINY